MRKVKRFKVSFIDKDTMCAMDPELVHITVQDGELVANTDYYLLDDPRENKEVEIKII